MLKIVRASVLLLTLTVAASAGEGPNSATGQPTPPAPIMTQETTAAEADTLQETTTQDSFGETLLSLLNSMLALF